MNLSGLKTYIGILIAIAPSVANLFGYDLAPTFGEEFASLAEEIITLIGAGLAIYGRAVAQTPGWFSKRD